MSKFTTSTTTMHALSRTAMEEASRVGSRTADLDHLLIALALSEQPAGQILRSLGVTCDAARAAAADQHAQHLASVGIVVAPPVPGEIVFDKTGGYEWSDRALAVLKNANKGMKQGDASAVLRELLTEPSGTITALLDELGTASGEVAKRLDELDRLSESDHGTRPPSDVLTGAATAFVPAPLEEVWALLASPARMPEWDYMLQSVTASEGPPTVGDVWEAHTRTEQPNGKPLSIKPETMRQLVELLAFEPSNRIAWRYSYPEAERANSRRLSIELEPAAAGTQLRIAAAWERHPARRRRLLSTVLLRPVFRVVMWIQLSQVGNGIGRVFR